jgi:hypothetical protein
MTIRIATWALPISLAGTVCVLLAPTATRAQCGPDDDVCVQVETRDAPQAESQPAARETQVIVVEEGASVPAEPQPPRVIIVEGERAPQPPPQAAPQAEPQYAGRDEPFDTWRDPQWDQPARPHLAEPRFGIAGHIGGAGGRHTELGGFGFAFRLRPIPHIGIDLGVAFYAGRDYNEMDRREVPFTADLLVFVNPYSPLQLYFTAGVGVSFARADGIHINTGRFESREYAHAGGQAGVGLEWRISRRFALNGDIRVFIRQRVDDDPRPEFEEGGRATDTSAGVVGRLGAVFYLGR